MSLIGGMPLVGGAGWELSGRPPCLARRLARAFARPRFQPRLNAGSIPARRFSAATWFQDSLTAPGSIQTSLIASNKIPVTTPPTAPSPTIKTAPSGVPPHHKN